MGSPGLPLLTVGAHQSARKFAVARDDAREKMRLLLHSWFCLATLVATVSASGALGIDVGSANSVVAVTRRGGVDVVANEATKRQTPSVVAFDERRRFMGESASALRSSRPSGCVAGSKALLGCEDTGTDQVDYLGRKRTFSPIQIFAMLLHHLHVTAEREHGSALPECALAVPAHWGAAQRQAVLDAAEVAGTRCVRLISDVRRPPAHRVLPPRPPTARAHRTRSATTTMHSVIRRQPRVVCRVPPLRWITCWGVEASCPPRRTGVLPSWTPAPLACSSASFACVRTCCKCSRTPTRPTLEARCAEPSPVGLRPSLEVGPRLGVAVAAAVAVAVAVAVTVKVEVEVGLVRRG